MINELAYKNGVSAAMGDFLKLSNVPVMNFPKKPVAAPRAAAPAAGAPPAAPVAGAPAAPVAPAAPPAGPVLGGAAAPGAPQAPAAPAAPGAAAPKQNFMDSWKGQLAMGVGVPLVTGAIQNMMTPAQKDPNGL